MFDAKVCNNYCLIPLAEAQHLRSQCIELLNEEWPRSITQRERSMDECLNVVPPMSMILLNSNKDLVGHARLCLLPNDENACWLESIVIWRHLRGRGLGLILMKCLEDKILQLQLKKIFLSTHNKEKFYEKCGFSYCPPVPNFKANSKLSQKCLMFMRNIEVDQSVTVCNSSMENIEKPYFAMETQLPQVQHPLSDSVPPPPPLPFSCKSEENVTSIRRYPKIIPQKQIYMCKYLE